MFTRLYAIVIPLVLVGLLGLCFVKIQQPIEDAVHVLRDTLLAESVGEQSDSPRMTYQQLKQVIASITYYRVGFYGGAFLLLVYTMIMAMRPAPTPKRSTPTLERQAFKPEPPAPKPVSSAPSPAPPLPKQAPLAPQQAPPAPQPSIPGNVRLADDVHVEDEQPLLTAELPRPTDIVTRSNRSKRSS